MTIAITQGKRRTSAWLQKNTLYPYPVYVAHVTGRSGLPSSTRRSFWQQPGKPWDFKRGRNLCGRVISGYVLHAGRRFDDPMQEPVKRAKRGPTAAQWRKLVERILDDDNDAVREAKELLAA